jgi:hypothetical protein
MPLSLIGKLVPSGSIFSIKTPHFYPKPGVNLALNKKPLIDFSCKWLILRVGYDIIELMIS